MTSYPPALMIEPGGRGSFNAPFPINQPERSTLAPDGLYNSAHSFWLFPSDENSLITICGVEVGVGVAVGNASAAENVFDVDWEESEKRAYDIFIDKKMFAKSKIKAIK